MKILFVLHDLSLTGAPKLGVQIAEAFAQKHEVILVSKKDGPLSLQINKTLIPEVVVTNSSHELGDTPVEDRIQAAQDLIRKIGPDLVYINSFAAAEWLAAAKDLDIRAVLHTHEMKTEITSLLSRRIFRPESISKADYIVAASEECMWDAINIFRIDPLKAENFSVCVDIDLIQQLSKEEVELPTRYDGQALSYTRPLITMCGLACTRKGSDLFFEAAKMNPDKDFLWVGPWDDEIGLNVNPAVDLNEKNPLENLYWTNSTRNPYAFISKADLFILTSREDPNPLVVPESWVLGIPTVVFAGTGGSHSWTRRYGFALSGSVSVDRIQMFIERYFTQDGFEKPKGYDERLLPEVDLKEKASRLLQKVEDVCSATSRVKRSA